MKRAADSAPGPEASDPPRRSLTATWQAHPSCWGRLADGFSARALWRGGQRTICSKSYARGDAGRRGCERTEPEARTTTAGKRQNVGSGCLANSFLNKRSLSASP